ncbi:MAG TPA: hypothetical protein VK633_02270, partial [Verrucomicrobiae bacterium]|nr:hypothetical protein [Verrucomicrobiae bacterium]
MKLALGLFFGAFSLQVGFSAITGQWDFESAGAPLTGTIGQPIEYLDGAGGATAAQTRFGTAASFGIANIGGATANVMKFGTNGFGKGYAVPHGVPANGEGTLANNWSIIMDVLFPSSSNNKWRALLQNNSDNPENDDAEFYINESNAIGINGAYHGAISPDSWTRIALVGSLSSASPKISKYINGVKVGELAATLDSRFSLTPDAAVLLFTDGYSSDVYTQPGYINSLQIHDEALSDAYIATLGRPSAAGIPTQVQSRPFIRTIQPAPGTNSSPEQSYTAVIENGVEKLNTNSVRLMLSGQNVTPSFSAASNLTSISYTGPVLFPASSTNTWVLVFAGDTVNPVFETNTTTVVIAPYADLRLPAPLYFENFETTAEGSLPTGWASLSYSEITNPDEDLGNLDSATYARWTVVDSKRFKGSFVTYSNPQGPQSEAEDYHRVLEFNPIYVVNGQLVKPLAQGKIAFADSGYRNGLSQVLYLFSP